MLPPASQTLWRTAQTQAARRMLHATSSRGEVTKFQMPAMSPTMTEGGISQWKKKDGESFTAGDVLLEIETDKATIDVEAQEDGIIGKIIAPDGTKNVSVGKIIALLAQEGDDISNLEIPADESTTSSSSPSSQKAPPSSPRPPQPDPTFSWSHASHDRPLFPSVLRLLKENKVSDLKGIKGTGIRGMLTKGDILAYLGKASGPNGTDKGKTPTPSVFKSQAVLQGKRTLDNKLLDPLGIRQVILAAFLERSANAGTSPPSPLPPTFDSVTEGYLPSTLAGQKDATPPVSLPTSSRGYLDGIC